MHLGRPFAISALTALALLATACASTPPPPPPEPAPVPSSEFREAAPPPPPREDVIPELKTIYFDYNKSAIRSDAGQVLRDNASTISKYTKLGTVTLQGHCDERGSEEYNIALGEQRALSVRNYLRDLGVNTRRLETVSFGELRPAVMGHDESAWRWNRRVDFATRQ